MKKFNKQWTRRAVLILRNAQSLVHQGLLKQRRNDWGKLDANGHGSACANQVLFEYLDALRDPNRFWDRNQKERWIDQNLPVTTTEIISMNDSKGYTFSRIADEIERAAGGPEALEA